MPREYCSSCAAEVPVDDGICFFGHEVTAGDEAVPVDDVPELVGSATSDLAAQSHETADDETDAGLPTGGPVAAGAPEFGQSESAGVSAVDNGSESIEPEDDDISGLAAYQIVEPDDDQDNEPTIQADSPEIIEPEDDNITELAAYQIVEPDDDQDDEPTIQADGPEVIEPEDDEVVRELDDGRVEIDVGGDDDVDVAALEAAIAELEGQGSEDLLTDDDEDFVVLQPDEGSSPIARESEEDEGPSVWESGEDQDDSAGPVSTDDWSANDGFDHDVVAEWELDGEDEPDAPTEPADTPLAEQALAEGGLSAHRARGESDIDDLLDQGDFEGGLTWEQDVVIEKSPADDSEDSDVAQTDTVADDADVAEDEEPTDDVDDGSIWGEVFGDEEAETSDAPATHDEWDLGEFDEPETSPVEDAVDPAPTEERTYEPEAAEPVPADEPQEPEEPAFEGDPTIDTSSFTAHGKGKKKGLLSRLFG